MKVCTSHRGFTLVEFMVVISIVAVLAGISFPLYQGYVARTQVMRVMSELGYLRDFVESCLAVGSRQVGSGTGQCDLQVVSQELISSFSPSLSSDPVILRVSLGGHMAAPLHGLHLSWVRGADGAWTCRSNVSARYLPSGCEME